MKENILSIAEEAGFRHPAHLIHAFIGGSELHGAKVKGTDDKDWYGLYIEPPNNIIGLYPDEHFVWSTSGNDKRNGPEDVDITLYGLRKWASMAGKGNPNALHFLFAPNVLDGPEWEDLKSRVKNCVIAKSSAKQFKGFVDAQMGRLLGTRGVGKHGQRPELEQNFGYDVKAGMHAVRLLNECLELMRYGRITLPRPERELLIDIRTGKWSLDRLSTFVNKLFIEVKEAEEKSWLPDEPNKCALSGVVVDAYLRHWRY